MKNHILILNVPGKTLNHYLQRLVSEFRESRRFRHLDLQVVVRGLEDGLPAKLSELGAVHFDGEPWMQTTLEAVNAQEANVIVVLAHVETDPESDARSFDIVDRLREMGANGRIIVECVDDRNRGRLRRAGADILVRPLRGYPEMIVRALAAPGAEAILEDMFTSRGDECWRYDVKIRECAWIDLATHLLKNDIGLPIAFGNQADGQMIINPKPTDVINADKLFVLLRENNARSDLEIETMLRTCGVAVG